MARQPAVQHPGTDWTPVRKGQELLDRGEFAAAHLLAVEAEQLAGRLTPQESDPRLQATATALLAQTHYRLDRYLESMNVGTRAVRLWRELGDPAGGSMPARPFAGC